MTGKTAEGTWGTWHRTLATTRASCLSAASATPSGVSLTGSWADKAAEWFAALGKPQEEAAALAAREQVCIRFGDKAEAVAFAKVLEQNKLYCAALVDKEGNGYVQFFADDLKEIQKCVPELADTLLRQQEWRLAPGPRG